MKKEVKNESIKSYRLMVKSGMIIQIEQGLYFFTPLGLRVLKKVESIIEKSHQKLGFNQCEAPTLQPGSLWEASGRMDAYDKELMHFKDRNNRVLILGPTAEEVFTKVAKQFLTSEHHLPLLMYNIQTKYRDEIRPRFGLMRCREFCMSDGYSFHKTTEESIEFYYKALDEYKKMFSNMGFSIIPIQQKDTGPIGGSLSHEFFAESEEAEDSINFEVDGKQVSSRGIEVGHIYYLGQKYSEKMDLKINNTYLQMGCYGVGVSRCVAALVQLFGREDRCSIFLPEQVTPFMIHLIADEEFMSLAEQIHSIDEDNIYFDNTAKHMREKLAIADLIGAPMRIIIGKKFKKDGKLDIKEMIEIKNKEYYDFFIKKMQSGNILK